MRVNRKNNLCNHLFIGFNLYLPILQACLLAVCLSDIISHLMFIPVQFPSTYKLETDIAGIFIKLLEMDIQRKRLKQL